MQHPFRISSVSSTETAEVSFSRTLHPKQLSSAADTAPVLLQRTDTLKENFPLGINKAFLPAGFHLFLMAKFDGYTLLHLRGTMLASAGC